MSEFEAFPEEQTALDQKVEPVKPWHVRLGNAAVIGAAAAAVGFEQSPANEALRINVGLDVLQQTQSPEVVGLTIAGITAGIEMGSAALVTLGLHAESGFIERLKQKRRNKLEEKTKTEADREPKHRYLTKVLDAGADTGIALGIGAALVTVKHHVQEENPTIAKDLKTSAKATGIVAGVSGLIGYLAAGGIENAEKIGLGTPAEWVVDYGTDTKFWMGILAVGYGGYYGAKGISKLRRRWGRSRDRDSEATTASETVEPTVAEPLEQSGETA